MFICLLVYNLVCHFVGDTVDFIKKFHRKIVNAVKLKGENSVVANLVKSLAKVIPIGCADAGEIVLIGIAVGEGP